MALIDTPRCQRRWTRGEWFVSQTEAARITRDRPARPLNAPSLLLFRRWRSEIGRPHYDGAGNPLIHFTSLYPISRSPSLLAFRLRTQQRSAALARASLNLVLQISSLAEGRTETPQANKQNARACRAGQRPHRYEGNKRSAGCTRYGRRRRCFLFLFFFFAFF